MSESRIGEVWEHVEVGCVMLVLEDEPRLGFEGVLIAGWTAASLEDGRIDWLPNTCFSRTWWRRLA